MGLPAFSILIGIISEKAVCLFLQTDRMKLYNFRNERSTQNKCIHYVCVHLMRHKQSLSTLNTLCFSCTGYTVALFSFCIHTVDHLALAIANSTYSLLYYLFSWSLFRIVRSLARAHGSTLSFSNEFRFHCKFSISFVQVLALKNSQFISFYHLILFLGLFHLSLLFSCMCAFVL